jgi:hypothetical protein
MFMTLMEKLQQVATWELSFRNEPHPWQSEPAKQAYIYTNEVHYWLGQLPTDMRSHVSMALESHASESLQRNLQEHITLLAESLKQERLKGLIPNPSIHSVPAPEKPTQYVPSPLHKLAFWSRSQLAEHMPKTPRDRFYIFIGPLEDILARLESHEAAKASGGSRARQNLLTDIETLHAFLGMMPTDMRSAVAPPKPDDGMDALYTKLLMHISVVTSAIEHEVPRDGEDFPPQPTNRTLVVPRAYLMIGGIALIAFLVAYKEERFSSFLLYAVAWAGLSWLLPCSLALSLLEFHPSEP